jgi:hypothetical protein
MDILPLNDNNVLHADGQIYKVDNLIAENKQLVYLDTEELNIPYRLYFNEPNPANEKLLTDLQKVILNCLYTRHHNGLIRQRRLENLLVKSDYFIVPFSFQLLGEYVIEILEVLDRHINPSTIDSYVKFKNENRQYWATTQSRVVSYWDAYYRRTKYHRFDDYIGKQIIDKFKNQGATRASSNS